MVTANQTKKRRMRFGCLLGALLLLIMIRYALQIDIPRVLFLIIIGLAVLWGDRTEIVAMCICCIPMHESIDFFYAIVICCAIYVFKYYRRMRIGANVVLVLVIALWELLHCIFTEFDIVIFLVYIIPFIVLAILMASDTETLDYPFIVRVFAWTALGISIVLFIRVLYFSNFNIALALAGLQRMGSDLHSNIEDVTVAGGEINPNSLGIITVLASTGLMQLRSMKAGQKSDMILMCTMLVFAALGTSRTYLACLALMIVLLIFSERGGLVKKIRLVLVLGLSITAAIVVMALFFPESFEYFIGRFIEEDITTGRNDLMIQYHEFIVNNPKVMFLGIGLQDFGNRLIDYYMVSQNVPHNSIQEIIIAWGIPGLVLFVLQLFNMYQISWRKNRNQSLLNWIPLIIILFKGIAGQTITSSYTMLALSFAYLSLCQNFNSNTKFDESSL